MANKTIFFSGYKSGVTTLTAKVLSYDGVTTIQTVDLAETAVGSSVYSGVVTAAATGTKRVTILRSGSPIGSFLVDLAEAVGNYDLVDGPTADQIAAKILADPTNPIETTSEGHVITDVDDLNATIEFESPLNETGTRLILVQGDDYCEDNGRSLTFSIENRPELIGTVAHLRFKGQTDDACVSDTITSGTQDIVMGDLVADYTSELPVSDALDYQLRFIINDLTATVINGTAKIYKGL